MGWFTRRGRITRRRAALEREVSPRGLHARIAAGTAEPITDGERAFAERFAADFERRYGYAWDDPRPSRR
jgi:hypothetical protein